MNNCENLGSIGHPICKTGILKKKNVFALLCVLSDAKMFRLKSFVMILNEKLTLSQKLRYFSIEGAVSHFVLYTINISPLLV